MYDSVKVAWPAICREHEGVAPYMYLDVKGKVTTGVGFLVDSVEQAQSLPWWRGDGHAASRDEVAAEWRRVKALTKWQHRNGLDAVWRDSARLHLTLDVVDVVLGDWTPTYWRGVVKSAPNVEQAPADAQLALVDLAWQNGPAFLDGWPDTRAAVRAGDWSRVREVLASFLPRGGARTTWRLLRLQVAAAVITRKANPTQLYATVAAVPMPAPVPVPIPEVPPVAPVKWSTSSKYDGQKYRKWRGGNMTPTGIAVCEAIPSTVVLVQGGLSSSVAASANTHAGLGAYDLSVTGLSKKQITELCAELIRSGECAFPRGKAFGSSTFSPHVHVASANDYDSLHPEAQAQVRDFKKKPRRDGLYYHRAYVGPSTPLGSWKESPYNPANLKAPAAAQYRVVVKELLGLTVDRKPRSGHNRKKGYVINADRLVRRWGRWNLVTSSGSYYAVADSKQTYLEPIVPPAPPAATTKETTR